MENQDTGGLKWLADHDTKNPDLLKELFDSPEVKALRLSEVEQRAIHAENIAVKASNDAAIAKENSEKCSSMATHAQDYTRICKSLNTEIAHNTRQIRIFTTFAMICNIIAVVVLLIAWLWR